MRKLLFLLIMGSGLAFSQGSIFDEITGTINDLTKITLNIVDISDSEENDLGAGLAADIDKNLTAGSTKRWDVDKVFKKILKFVDRKGINYNYKIVNDKEVNAFAIAGGRIYLNTGILNFVKSEDELAFVIAHELGHIEKKHCINKIKLTYLAGKFDVNLAMLVDAMKSVYDVPFSKYDEYEADEYGVTLLKKAGYKKFGAIAFFKRLAEHFKETDRDPVNDFVASHPLSLERAKRIENMQ